MSQAERLGLADVDAVDPLGHHVAHELQQLRLAASLQLSFQFIGLVEMVLDRPLAAPGDEDHVGDARRHGLLDRVLDQRLVHDGHHFLGAGLGGRQKAGAETGDGEDRFGNFFHLAFLSWDLS